MNPGYRRRSTQASFKVVKGSEHKCEQLNMEKYIKMDDTISIDMVSIYIRKLNTSQRNHIKAHSKIVTCNDQNQTLIMLLKENELQESIDEVKIKEEWCQTT